MSTRSILISYAGYPYTPSSLMPDNGYANLAGELLREHHETLILDYGTTDFIRRLMPKDISGKVLAIAGAVFGRITKGEAPAQEDLNSLMKLDRELERIHSHIIAGVIEEIAGLIKKIKPHFIGFKLWNGDGFSGSVKIAEELKARFPNLKIFAGGPHVDIFKELIFKRAGAFDAISFGEGEETILELAEHSEGKRPVSDVHNIIYRQNGSYCETEVKRLDNLDTLAHPVYDDDIYPSMAGDRKLKIIVLDESRGCPCCCHFCIQPVKSGTKVRMKSPERVVEEMKRIVDNYGIRLFRYAGSATPPALSKSIADKIIETGLDVEYTAFGNILGAKPEYFRTLKKSGCYSIFFGVESGSPEIQQRSFGKFREPRHMAEVLKACRSAGIYTVASIIYPAPFETEQTSKETIDLMLDAKPHSAPVQFPAVYPQTRWANSPADFGFSFTGVDWQEKLLDYKIKLLFPPTMWEPLPYSVDGKPFKQFAFETFKLISLLEKNGILTAISDDQALMAKYSGFEGRENQFRELARQWFLAGDSGSIEDMVTRINSNQGSKSVSA